MKETVRALETGALAEIAILAFVIAFVAICAYAFMLTKTERTAAKHMPLDDAMPAPGASPEAEPVGASGALAAGDGAATASDDLLLTL